MGMITIDEKKKKKFAYHRICVFCSISKTCYVWSLDFDKLSSTYNSEYLIICPCSTSLLTCYEKYKCKCDYSYILI